MRVFTATLAAEINTFAPMPTGLASFRDFGYYPAGTHPDHMTIYAGPLWAARLRGAERNWQLFEGVVAGAQPNGIVTRQAYEALRAELLEDLRQALPLDMVLLGLHGAMVADGYDDCEGDVLEHVRGLVGKDVVIGVEIDPHCHLSPAMVEKADMIVAFKEYPHDDILERGLELVDLCAQMVEGKIRPVAALVDCEMITTIHTTREPARSFVDRIQRLEGKEGVLSISIAHGFAWGDVPDMGTKVLVYTDGQPERARSLARGLADELFAMREQLAVPAPGIDAALDAALGFEGGPVVLSDGADNPGGGAASDSTFILRRMLERGIGNAAIGPIWDPIAVRIAFDAGEGARLKLRIGGKIGPLSGDPLDLDCEVKCLKEGLVMSGLSNTPDFMGDCALVSAGGIDIVLATSRKQAMGTDLFTQLGCDLRERKIVVVKSSQHFYASFSKVAAHVIYVSAPGVVTLDLGTLSYQRIRWPRWPLLQPVSRHGDASA